MAAVAERPARPSTEAARSDTVTFRVWRGDASAGEYREYTVALDEGMVVLDVIHRIQATQAGDLAVRWNCKAGKCGSCSAEINGKPRLMCMPRMDTLPPGQTVQIEPMKTFPLIRDLVTNVSWNYRVNKMIPKFKPRRPDAADGTWRMSQEEVDRIQEFRKCIECFLCQDVCHVLRDHDKKQPPEVFGGTRFKIRRGSPGMQPPDTRDRLQLPKNDFNIGLCNITKCCTEV